MIRGWAFVAAALCCSIVVADPIRVGLAQEPDTLFPRMTSMAAASEIGGLLFVGLVTLDDDWRLQPAGAETLPTQRNKLWQIERDGQGRVVRMRVTWKLRRGLKWSDGRPVTAGDYLFAHQVLTDPRVRIADRSVEARIERLEATDDHTLVAHWKGAFAYANCFGMRAHSALPRHLLEAAYRAAPEKLHLHAFARRPIGNGPFVLDAWEPGKQIAFRPNPHWHAGPPAAPGIVYRFLPAGRLVRALQRGEIDAISPTGAPLARIEALARQPDPRLAVQIKPGVIWEHIDFKLSSAMLRDARVRRALVGALDRPALLSALLGRKHPVARSWLPDWHYGYERNIPYLAHDPAQAGRLLDAAGWTAPAPGAVRRRAGRPLRLELLTTAGARDRERLAGLLAAQWRKAGVEIVVVKQPAAQMFGETLRHRKFKHLALYAWIMGPLSDGEDLWSGSRVPSAANGWSGQNYPGLRDAGLTRLQHQIPRTIDGVERARLLRRQQMLWAEALPAIPLYFRPAAWATVAGFEGWKPTRTFVPVTWNADRWKIVRR